MIILTYASEVLNVAFSPNGEIFLINTRSDGLALWNSQADTLLRIFDQRANYSSCALFSPDNITIFLGIISFGDSELLDIQTGKMLHLFSSMGGVDSAAFSPDGKYILIGSSNGLFGLAELFDIQKAKSIQSFNVKEDLIDSVALSPDGTTIFTLTKGEIQVWDIKTGVLLRTFSDKGENFWSMVVSRDGKFMFVGCDHDVHIWNIATGTQIHSFYGHADVILSMALSTDGKFLLTGSNDRIARVWDIEQNQLLYTLKGHTAAINSVAFSLDAKTILTGSDDKTVRVWKSPEDLNLGNYALVI